ncbi:Dipeptide epimerase [Sphingomonas antarctica]|uniref:dipeptide epimerase n=1 Tax=Sphingomonas antarctica TaxID=2040274 RepID=UPI0039EB1E6C
MPGLKLKAERETVRLAKPFRISGHVFQTSDVVVVTLDDGTNLGRGEGGGVYYLNDDADHMMAEIERARAAVEKGLDRETLLGVLPPGGARNAIDSALWELEARSTDTPVWELAGLASPPKPLLTTFTVGADAPDVMARDAVGYSHARAIKVKLTGDVALDGARVRAIRSARPDVWLGVDGNQGFGIAELPDLVDAMAAAGVSQVEQPLARGREVDLDGFRSAVPLAADESAVTFEDTAGLVGRFDIVNIKLDKCGGLTEGLRIAAEAKRLGLTVMVGNMVGTSLSVGPGFILGQLCDIVDLDGPIFLAEDRQPAVKYQDGMVWAGPEVWGSR